MQRINTRRQRRLVLRVWLTFLGLFGLQMLLFWWADPIVAPRVNRWTAEINALALKLLGVAAYARGPVVINDLSPYEVIWECTGVTPICLFLAGVGAYPSRWRQKLIGVLLGVTAILLINQIRLVSLVFIDHWWPSFTDTAHLVVWQSLIVFFTVLLWLIWVARLSIALDLNPRSLFRFAARFLLAFCLLALLFPWIVPAYRGTLHSLANPILQRLSVATTIEPLPQGGWRYVDTNSRGETLETIAFDGSAARLQTLNLILLPALILATPFALRRRWALAGQGLLILFALDFVTTLVWAAVARCALVDAGPLCGALFYTLITGGQIFSVALWALLSWRESARDVVRGETPRNAPCPCGSSRKYKHCCGKDG